MPSQKSNGRTSRHRMGFVALGYSKKDNYWYSSEGVFSNPADARRDLDDNYPTDFSYAVKVPLTMRKIKH